MTDGLIGDRFQIDRKVGAGGMGEVFRARDLKDQRWVAVKLFSWRTANEVERAHREVQVLAGLHHPAIVGHVADGITADGQLYLAMDWLEGTTVADRLDGGGLTVREAVAIAQPIADALAHAHDIGVLHRDIKPSNVLLVGNDPNRAMLIDFGVAGVLDATSSLTRTGTAIGTPGYMSPEQVRGTRDLTTGIDIFGLGCLLYECITGKPAFSGKIAAAVMAKILFVEPDSIFDLAPEAPNELVVLVENMLKKQIVYRTADCQAVLEALAALPPIPDGPRRGSRGVVAQTLPPPPPSVRPVSATKPTPQLYMMVGATRGMIEDKLEPPPPEACAKLAELADEHGASLEVFSTGAVIAHLSGDATHVPGRAAALALAMRPLLPGWSIAISSGALSGNALETGTQLLNGAAMAAIFQKGPAVQQIAVDAESAKRLEADFEIAPGKLQRLVGPKGPA